MLSDIGGSDRREVRLHFLHSVPILDLSILFFIDASAPLAQLPAVLEDLVYHVTYARNRAGGTKYVGVVLNKQDLLLASAAAAGGGGPDDGGDGNGKDNNDKNDKDNDKDSDDKGPRDRAATVAAISREVTRVMAQVMKEPLREAHEDTIRWEVLDGGKGGISAKTGEGVRDVFDTVARAVFGVDKLESGLRGAVSGGLGLLETVAGGLTGATGATGVPGGTVTRGPPGMG